MLRILVVTAFSLFLSAPAAFAKSKGKASIGHPAHARLLTYQQLMRLPKAKRMKYLSDLREVLIIMERGQRRYEMADTASFDNLKEYVARMMREMRVMPEAEAQVPAQLEARLNREKPMLNGDQWVCGRNSVFVDWAATCFLVKDRAGNGLESLNFAANGVGAKAKCIDGAHKIYDRKKPYGVYCIPADSWAALDRNMRETLDLVGVPDESARQSLTSKFNQFGMEDQKKLAIGGGDVVGDELKKAAGDKDKAADGGETADTAAKPAEGGASCDGQFTCEPPADANAAASLRKSLKGTTCIAAGFTRSYEKGRERQIGGCKIPHDGSSVGLENYPKCKSSEAFCNPTVFCAVSKGKDKQGGALNVAVPICVPIVKGGGNPPITRSCNDKYTEILGAGKHTFQNGKLGMVEMKVSACGDISDDPNLKYREELTKLLADTQAQYNAMCVDDPSARSLFCDECLVLHERLSKMASLSCSPKAEEAAPAEENKEPVKEQKPPVRQDNTTEV